MKGVSRKPYLQLVEGIDNPQGTAAECKRRPKAARYSEAKEALFSPPKTWDRSPNYTRKFSFMCENKAVAQDRLAPTDNR